jgi:hypothetical protein
LTAFLWSKTALFPLFPPILLTTRGASVTCSFSTVYCPLLSRPPIPDSDPDKTPGTHGTFPEDPRASWVSKKQAHLASSARFAGRPLKKLPFSLRRITRRWRTLQISKSPSAPDRGSLTPEPCPLNPHLGIAAARSAHAADAAQTQVQLTASLSVTSANTSATAPNYCAPQCRT